MGDSFTKSVQLSRTIKALPDEMIVPKTEWDSYYHHFTLRVRSLAEYVDVISRLTRIIKYTTIADTLVFRGHSDASSKYKLIPSLARKQSVIEGIENRMVMEMLSLRPEEFSGIKTDFDLLAKLQHFGLPTRILDFTYNPLIALYFACCSEKKTDSRVICTYDTSDASTMGTVEKICGTYKYTDYNAVFLDTLLGGVSQLRKYQLDIKEPLMAKPRYANDRIKHQSAIFMVFPNVVYDHRSRMVIEGRKIGDEHEYQFFQITAKEEQRLKYIHKEPDFYNGDYHVCSKTLIEMFRYYGDLFPDFFSGTDFGINPVYHYLLRSRFSITNSIQELSEEQIANAFISILIEGKDRKKIIQELAMIGINKAFVFPELEYTAETVKNKYF